MVFFVGGKMAESEIKPVRQGQPGDDLVMAGYMGLRGSAAAVRAERGILLRRLPETLLQNILVYEKQQTRRLEGLTGEAAAGAGVSAWYHLGEAGVEGGLWEIAGRWNTGFAVQLLELPVRQETIEVCEILGMNPYSLDSQGCVLLATAHGKRLCGYLKEQGWPAAVVGELRAGREKILLHKTARSCLNRPSEDEWIRYLRKKEEKLCTARQEKEEERGHA